MIDIHKSTCGLALKVLSTVSGGIFLGGALYIDCVEHPARMTHDPTSAITMWKPSFERAKSMQAKMAIMSGLSSLGAYACLRGEADSAMNWLACGSTMLSILPFTLIFIVPLNAQLVETEKCISVKGDDWIKANLNHWQRLHTVRTILSLGAVTFMAYSLTR